MEGFVSSRNFTNKEMRDNLIFILAVYIPLDLVIICGNAFVLVVVRRTPSLQEPQFTLLGSLALVDLLTGIVGVPIYMWGCVTRGSLYLENTDDCHLQYVPMKIFIATSYFHLLFITVDRYVSIVKALKYEQIVTRTRVYCAIAFSWIAGCVYGSIQLFWKSQKVERRFLCFKMDQRGLAIQRYGSLVLIPTGVILLIVMYSRIYMEARKLRKSITPQAFSTQTAVQTKFKAAKTCAIVVCLFGAAYLPHSLRPAIFSLGIQRSDVYWYELLQEFLFCMSSAVNPFIYVYRHKQFSSALHRLWEVNSQSI